MKPHRRILLTLLSCSLITAFRLNSVSAGPSHPSELRSVSVTGECSKKVSADRVSVQLTAETTARDIKEAVKNTTVTYEKLRDGVKKLNLEELELETTEYSVQEIKEWEKDRSVSKGFRARMGLEVSTRSLSRIGEVLTLAAREEIKDVGALRTLLSRDRLKTEKAACLEAAALDARAQAEKLVLALGTRLGEVLSLAEGDAPLFQPPQRPMGSLAKLQSVRAMSDEEISPPHLETPLQEIRVRVHAQFGIR